ncbi:MAG: PD40 domain-containing protein [Ignavibacteriales bacterium]|nr:PD40 domain-containing protein [Ignavibacteriales bacterium]
MKLTSTFLAIYLISSAPSNAQNEQVLKFKGENNFASVKQLTFGGENAEAYFSSDNTKIIFQSTRDSFKCDQIFTMNVDGSNVQLVSAGKGRTTCAYFLSNDTKILFSSTHLHNELCPPPPDYSKGYVWNINPDYDVLTANADGSDLKILSASDGYDAEATVSPKGDKIVFTSTRDGDLELYSMNIDGTNIKRLTNEIGYDGGAFFSPDGKKICYRSFHPRKDEEIESYQTLLKQNLVRPTTMEICIMNADGTGKKQLTFNGKANFAPFFHPDGNRIIFASNMHDTSKQRRNFDLFLLEIESGKIEQVTYNETFDSFPMFTSDGKKLIFASNRNAKVRGETNIFIADWKE